MKIPPCEVEVIKGLCTGETEKEIASRLGKSSHTVHNQVNQAMKRFNVRCRTSLAIAAIRDGIIQIDTIRLLQRE